MEKLSEFWRKRGLYLAGGAAILIAVALIAMFVRHLVLQTRFRDARAALASALPQSEEIVLRGAEGEVPGMERDVTYYMEYIEDNSTICGGGAPKTVSADAVELQVGEFSLWFTDQDGIWGWVQWMDGGRLVGFNLRGTLDFDHLIRYYHLAVQNRS